MSSDKVKSIRTGVFIDGSNLFWAMNMRDEKTGEKLHYNICFEKTLAWELKEFAIKNPRCNYKLLDDLKEELEFIPKIKA